MQIRTLIVDDEPLARRRLRAFLRTEADMEIVGECGNGEDARRALCELQPDLLLLDVQMPGMDGFALLGTIERAKIPHVIFVTAHDSYAVRAFEERALDYLLKPFSRKRFQEAVSRVRERLEKPEGNEDRRANLLRALPAILPRVAIRCGPRTVLLDPARIEWLEAEGDYVRVHAGRDTHLTRHTLNGFEMQLSQTRFVRVHRSAIVNIDCIQEIHSLPGGDHLLALRGGAQVTLSRGYRDRLERALGQKF